MNRCLLTLLLVSALAVQADRTFAQLPVHVVLPPQAHELVRLAANELAEQHRRIFDVQVSSSTMVPRDVQHVVLIGTPANNPAIKDAVGDQWPAVSDQGIVLKAVRSQGRHCVIVGGGSPVATLWAVYELGHRHGIRYLLREDVDPPKRAYPLDLFSVVMEPQLRTRAWITIDRSPLGPESWGLVDHERVLRQLAKMKFNRVLISVHPWQPFVDYQVDGVHKQTAVLWHGDRLRVDGETPGKKAFGGGRFFENLDFVGKSSYQEMTSAGIQLAKGISRAAHRLGMSVGLSISPLEFPVEFAKVLPGARVRPGAKRLMIGPRQRQLPDDPQLQRMVAAKIRAYLKTYPNIDALYLRMPEISDWSAHAASTVKQIDDEGDLKGSSERRARSVENSSVSLAFLRALLHKHRELHLPNGRQVELMIQQIDPALFPTLDRLVPQGAGTLNSIGDTARRIAENMELLAIAPADKVKCQLVLPLADDSVGLVAQSATRSLGRSLSQLQKQGWHGFSTRYRIPAELDSSMHFLSRAAFDASVTPRSAHDDLWLTLTDNDAATARLWKGFEHLESATELIDRHDPGFAFPAPGMLMKHYRADPLPDWFKQVAEHYNQWMIELYRANGAVAPRARKTLFYYAKRGEFNVYYLGAIEAVRNAAIAKKDGKNDMAIEELEKAVESLYNALTTLADVARGPSDRGLIAVLAEYAYRPLYSEYERMLDAAESQ